MDYSHSIPDFFLHLTVAQKEKPCPPANSLPGMVSQGMVSETSVSHQLGIQPCIFTAGCAHAQSCTQDIHQPLAVSRALNRDTREPWAGTSQPHMMALKSHQEQLHVLT